MFNNLSDPSRKELGYLLSLPERALRSLAALTGGTSLLLTDTLLPQSARQSLLFNATIGDLQRFMVNSLGQMHNEVLAAASFRQINADFPVRKAAGSVLETAGLLYMRFSPLWVFAIAGDAAAGSKVYLNRLTQQLKENNILPEDAQIDDLASLLEAVQSASRSTLTTIDTPPLTKPDFDALAADLRDGYGRVFASTTNLVSRMDGLWQDIEDVSQTQEASPAEIEGVMALDLIGWGKKGVGTVTAVTQTTGDLVGEHILQSYADTLDGIANVGLPHYIGRHMMPYLDKASTHFSPETITWTEKLLMGDFTPTASAPDDESAKTEPPE